MNFKEQYSNDMQHIIPTEEQCEKIRARVYEEIQKPQTIQMSQKRKKPLPLKTIAITGASVACLALVATVALKFSAANKFYENTAGGAAVNTIWGNDKTATDAAPEAVQSLSGFSVPAEGAIADTANDDYARPEAKDSIGFIKPSETVNSEASSALAVKMVFNDNMTECEMHKTGSTVKYTLIDDAPLSEEVEKMLALLPAINSNIEKTLYIYFEDDKMWLYDETKQFIGCYSEIG